MPYAIIRTGGHQEKVTPGEQITVDRLKQEVGEEVRFVPLMVAKDDGNVVTDKAHLIDATVVGKVVQHLKGDKVDIFQYRHKTGYRRHTGHRQPLTLVEIAEIRLGEEVFVAPPATEEAAPPQEPAEEEKPAKASKPRARAAAGSGKGGARKTPAKKAPAKK